MRPFLISIHLVDNNKWTRRCEENELMFKKLNEYKRMLKYNRVFYAVSAMLSIILIMIIECFNFVILTFASDLNIYISKQLKWIEIVSMIFHPVIFFKSILLEPNAVIVQVSTLHKQFQIKQFNFTLVKLFLSGLCCYK